MASKGTKPGRGNTGSGMDLGGILQAILGKGATSNPNDLESSSIAPNPNQDTTFGIPQSQGGTGAPSEDGAYAYTKYGYDPTIDYQSPTIDNRSTFGKIFKTNTSKKLNQAAAITRNTVQQGNQSQLDYDKQQAINAQQVEDTKQDKQDAELGQAYGTLNKSNIGGMTPQPTPLNFDSTFTPVQRGQQIRNIYGNSMIGQSGLATTIPNAQANLSAQMLGDQSNQTARRTQTLTAPTTIQTGVTNADAAKSEADNSLAMSRLKGDSIGSPLYESTFKDSMISQNRKGNYLDVPREATMWNLNDNSSITGMRPLQSQSGGMTITGPDGQPTTVGGKTTTSWQDAKMSLSPPKPSQAAIEAANMGPQEPPIGYQPPPPPSSFPSQASLMNPEVINNLAKQLGVKEETKNRLLDEINKGVVSRTYSTGTQGRGITKEEKMSTSEKASRAIQGQKAEAEIAELKAKIEKLKSQK